MSSLQTSFSSFKACGIPNKEDGTEGSFIHCLKPGVTQGAVEEPAAQLCGPYSGEEGWANDTDDLFTNMEELEEDKAAMDNDSLGNKHSVTTEIHLCLTCNSWTSH